MNFAAAFALLALGLLSGAPPAGGTHPAGVEADALCVLRALLHGRLRGYYACGLASLRADLAAVASALPARHAAAHARLAEVGLPDVAPLLPRWLLCLFVGVVPSDVTLRFWDAMLAAQPDAARAAARGAATALLAHTAPSLAAAADAGAVAAALRSAGDGVDDPCFLLRAALADADAAPSDADADLHAPQPQPLGRHNANANAAVAATPVASRKRKAAHDADAAAAAVPSWLTTPFAAAMHSHVASMQQEWQSLVAQSPLPSLLGSISGALGGGGGGRTRARVPSGGGFGGGGGFPGFGGGVTPAPALAESGERRGGGGGGQSGSAKRARRESGGGGGGGAGRSPLPWLQATPARQRRGSVNAATPATASRHGFGGFGAAAAAAATEVEMELAALRPRRLPTTPVRDVR
jgi:hypothetical protein